MKSIGRVRDIQFAAAAQTQASSVPAYPLTALSPFHGVPWILPVHGARVADSPRVSLRPPMGPASFDRPLHTTIHDTIAQSGDSRADVAVAAGRGLSQRDDAVWQLARLAHRPPASVAERPPFATPNTSIGMNTIARSEPGRRLVPCKKTAWAQITDPHERVTDMHPHGSRGLYRNIGATDLVFNEHSYHRPRGWHRRDDIRDRSSCWQTGRRRAQSHTGVAHRAAIVHKQRWSVGMT